MSNEIVKLQIRLTRDLRRKFSALLKLRETTQQQFLTQSIEKFVKDHNGELP